MKTLLLIFGLITVYFSTSFAAVTPDTKEYGFKYKFSGQTYEFKQLAGSYEEAFERVAVLCFNKLKNNQIVSEERGLDIIDVCANPRPLN
jgi:hypothetical protein